MKISEKLLKRVVHRTFNIKRLRNRKLVELSYTRLIEVITHFAERQVRITLRDMITTPIDYKSERVKRGLSASQVCKATGMSAPHLSQLENGKIASPSFSQVAKLYVYYFIDNPNMFH